MAAMMREDEIDMNQVVGAHDLVMMTLDTLRYDVAAELFAEGRTPNLRRVIGEHGWERRHTPGSFTYAAHHAFFAGFLPTPARPGTHPRLFAARFLGSATTRETTCAFDTADIVSGLAGRGYHTACVGGVGFFNPATPLGRVLPGLFDEAHWSAELGVTDPESTRNQLELASRILERTPSGRPVFLFVNVSALHQPNHFYLDGAEGDTIASHAAALEYVDSCLPILLDALARRARPTFYMFFADHGTAYGEDGFSGHRLSHPTVMNVPYAHGFLDWTPGESA